MRALELLNYLGALDDEVLNNTHTPTIYGDICIYI